MPKAQSILQSAMITIAMRWTDRLIGFISTLILARLLVPGDFGIIAMASLAVGLADVLLDLGVHVSLIRNQSARQEDFNTAWTLRLCQNTVAASLVFLSAPLVASYFKEPNVDGVMRWMALAMFIAGWENIGVVTFQKEMNFLTEFYFRFLRRFIGFVVTIIAAWLLRSYWALVIGTLAMRSSGVLLSYVMHPMRPRFSVSKMGEIFAVSQWVMFTSVGAYLNDQFHKIIVGQRTDAWTMGEYSLADDIACMPSEEILAPVNRVLFPAFARAAGEPRELKRLYLMAQSVQNLLAIPAAVGLIMVSEEMVRVLLGAKWMASIPYLQVLALVHIGSALTSSNGYVLIVLDRIRWNVYKVWTMLVTFAVLALLVFPHADAMELAWLRFSVGAVLAVVLSFWMLLHALPILHLRELLMTFVRPLIAAAGMALVLQLISPHFARLPTAVLLLTKCLTGALVYGMLVWLSWRVAGRPLGGESYVVDRLVARWRNR